MHEVFIYKIPFKKNSKFYAQIPNTIFVISFYNRDLTLCSLVVTIRTTSLISNNSKFYQRSVFMCFVWILEQTAIISLYSIN